MKVLIDIKNCRECPYSWGGDMHNPHESFVCSKLGDNIGSGEDVHEDCPLREYEQEEEFDGATLPRY